MGLCGLLGILNLCVAVARLSCMVTCALCCGGFLVAVMIALLWIFALWFLEVWVFDFALLVRFVCLWWF